MIVLAQSSHHVPLATRLLGHPVVGATAEATAHLIVRVLHHVFREVAGALTPSDHGDHPGVPWYCLGCGGPRDHEVAWRGSGRVGCEGETREGQGGEAASTCASVVVQSVEGTVGVEVFHGAIDGFVDWGRKVKSFYTDQWMMNRMLSCIVFISHFTLMLFIIGSRWRAGREWHPRQCPEVGVQRGRHDQALWRGHRCDGHLCHICGRDIQWLCFAGCPNPPHLPKNRRIFSHWDPLSFTKRQPTQLRHEHWWNLLRCIFAVTSNVFYHMRLCVSSS